MNKEEFENHLDSTLRLLEKAKELRYSDDSTLVETEQKRLTDFFMDEVTKLYLATKTSSSYKDAKYREFVRNSAYILNKLSSEIVDYIIKTENEVTGSFYYAEQWENRVCWRRSAIEALKEIYKNTSFEKFYYELDTEDLDDSIEMRAHKEGGLKEDQIPKGIPTSHWWWWSPEEPPSSR